MVHLLDDQLVSRSFILKKLNLHSSELKRLMMVGADRFPQPVVEIPHRRWSLNQVSRWLGRRYVHTVPASKAGFEIVLYSSPVGNRPPPGVSASFVRGVMHSPVLRPYIDQFFHGMDSTINLEDFNEDPSGILRMVGIPRHHPALIEMVKFFPVLTETILPIVTIDRSSYSIYVDDLVGDVLQSTEDTHDCLYLEAPGEHHQPKVPLVSARDILALVDKYRDTHLNSGLINELDNLLRKPDV